MVLEIEICFDLCFSRTFPLLLLQSNLHRTKIPVDMEILIPTTTVSSQIDAQLNL